VTRLEKEFYGKEEKAIGKIEGKIEGKKEKAEEIALGFYESDIEPALIVQITGVPAKRIIQLSIEKGRLN
jgi:predicted transposase YdaD